MAYGVRWEDHRARECIKQAETRACIPGRIWGLGYLYRFEDHTYAQRIDPWDDSDDNWTTVGPYLELTAFLIRSKTPKGHTIYASNGHGWRFINRESTKQYALPTVEDALDSFIARKKRQHAIYQARADKAERIMIRATEALGYLIPSKDFSVG